jgi:hypothetical protein
MIWKFKLRSVYVCVVMSCVVRGAFCVIALALLVAIFSALLGASGIVLTNISEVLGSLNNSQYLLSILCILSLFIFYFYMCISVLKFESFVKCVCIYMYSLCILNLLNSECISISLYKFQKH